MNDESANAFLKSLEEPTPQTMFLLLTDRPDAILPTIVSRCQRIDLPLSQGVLTSENYAAVAEVFETKGLVSFAAKGCAARHLTELLEQMEEDLPDGDFTSLRKDFFRTIMSFVRRWMIESSVPRHAAFANVEAVETAYRRCDRSNIPKAAALAAMMERLTFPS